MSMTIATFLDPVTSTKSVEQVEAFLKKEDLKLRFILETHAHADHLSGSQYLKHRFDARVAIGEAITEVQSVFASVFDLDAAFPCDGRQFDKLLAHGERLSAGSVEIEVIATPGHTPACVSYKIDDAVFTGDALFIEDYGTGRCDFPRGSAEALYTSVHDRLYSLPDATRVFVGHDYQPNGRELRSETTIGRSKKENVQLRESTSRDAFVKSRNERDAKLAAPRLLFPSVQVNIDAGRLPKPRANGKRYFTTPLNMKKTTNDDGTPV